MKPSEPLVAAVALAAALLSSCGGKGGAAAGAGGNAAGAGAAGSSGSGGAGGSSTECPATKLAAYAALPSNLKLPDPFTSVDGTRITTKAEWPCRRAEISDQLQGYELGQKPPRSGTVTGSVTGNSVSVTVEDGGKSISFTATIVPPSTGKPPYPAFITIGQSSLDNAVLSSLGVALIDFNNDDIAAQQDASSRGQGKFYTLFGANHGAGALIAWAWGVSRLIDGLEASSQTTIDTKHLGVTGCSRNGKGALVVGAYDERIALTIPQESGTGGSGLWRVADWQKSSGQNVETLAAINGEDPWFTSSFSQFWGTAIRLPYDHHMLMGMVAPRGLLVIENTSMEWLGNVSTFTGGMVAHRIYEALGVPDDMGYSQVGNHNHCDFPASQQPEVTAYVRKFLLDDASAGTAVLKTDGGFTLDEAKWVDWTTPTLK